MDKHYGLQNRRSEFESLPACKKKQGEVMSKTKERIKPGSGVEYRVIASLEFTSENNSTLAEINNFMSSCGFPDRLGVSGDTTIAKLTAKEELTPVEIKKVELKFLKLLGDKKKFKSLTARNIRLEKM